MIDAAAKEFTLFGFDEKHNLEIGGNRVHFSTGGAAVLMLDHETSTFRDSQLKDIFNIGRIIDKSDNIHMYVRTVVARDMESSKDLDFNTAYAAMSSTTECSILPLRAILTLMSFANVLFASLIILSLFHL